MTSIVISSGAVEGFIWLAVIVTAIVVFVRREARANRAWRNRQAPKADL